jgi:Ni/Co efflux regulator RcnB
MRSIKTAVIGVCLVMLNITSAWADKSRHADQGEYRVHIEHDKDHGRDWDDDNDDRYNRHGQRYDRYGDKDWNGRYDNNFYIRLRFGGIDREEANRTARMNNFYGYKPLPPGIRKNLMRGKQIPAGLVWMPIPAAYMRSLPRYPGYEWRASGTDLVLVAVGTAIIADVIWDALH